MKKIIMILLVLSLASISALAKNVVLNGEFVDGVTNWIDWNDGMGVWDAGESIWFGWADGSAIGQDTGHLIKPNTKYTMTVKVKTIDQAGGQAEGVVLIMQDVTAGWVDIVRERIWFPEEYNFGEGTNQESPWLEYSITFDSAVNTGVVGHSLCAALAVGDDGRWDAYGNLFVDSVSIIIEEAADPNPANGSTIRTSVSELSWINPAGTVKCDVWFGRGDANEFDYKDKLDKYEITGTDVKLPPSRQTYPMPEPLDESKYTWVVDCYRGSPIPAEPNIPGLVWSFTATDKPLIKTGPSTEVVDLNGTAEFTATFESPLAMTAKWYKEAGDPDKEMDNPEDPSVTVTITGPDPNNIYTTTLTISNVKLADEGQYYSIASNTKGSDSSATANLAVKRRMAYWTLDSKAGGIYADSSGEGHNATIKGDPNIVGGVKGNAATIDAVNGIGSAGTWDPTVLSGQLTVSCWVKWDAPTSGNQAILSKANNWQNPGVRWEMGCSSTGGVFVLGGTGQVGLPSETLKDGEWQFLAFTFDGTTGNLYSAVVSDPGNTLAVDTGSFTQGNGVDATVWIGARGTADTSVPPVISPIEEFSGLIDDVQIFNYASDVHGVVDLYNEVYPKNFCVNAYPSEYDTDSDCEIELDDLLEFITSSWLDCGLYPLCP